MLLSLMKEKKVTRLYYGLLTFEYTYSEPLQKCVWNRYAYSYRYKTHTCVCIQKFSFGPIVCIQFSANHMQNVNAYKCLQIVCKQGNTLVSIMHANSMYTVYIWYA